MNKIVLILVLSISVYASNLETDLSQCSKISNTVKKLECYENTTKKYNLSVKNTTKRASGKNRWIVNIKKDPLNDDKIITLINYAISGKGKYGSRISLITRCSTSNNPEVYINWNTYLGNKVYITSRFDQEKSQSREWSISSDSKASFYPYYNYEHQTPMLDKLIASNELVVRTTPYNESPITAIFDLSGFTKSVSSHHDICKIASKKEKREASKKIEANEKAKDEIDRKKKEEANKPENIKKRELKLFEEDCRNQGLFFVQLGDVYGCSKEHNFGLTFEENCENINGKAIKIDKNWTCKIQ